MVRLPSLVHVLRSAQETARRFPWTLLSAFISAGISWLLIRQSETWRPYEHLLSRLLLPAMLGISLFFALALCFERSRLAERRHWVGLAIGLTVLLLFGLSYSTDSPTIYIYRFFQLAVVSHLLVAVAPFFRRGNVAAFWEFNRILFQRILQSVLFSTILFAGLAIALWAVQSLLGVKVDWRAYYFLFLSVAFLFNTWFFLAGVPSDWQELESDYEYPAGLKMFVQFILLPLVTLYVVILYGYLGEDSCHPGMAAGHHWLACKHRLGVRHVGTVVGASSASSSGTPLDTALLALLLCGAVPTHRAAPDGYLEASLGIRAHRG